MLSIPFLPSVDSVVLGGTFAGMNAALQQARLGKSVLLIEARTYLGAEITATLRPWIPAGGEPYPELIAACISATGMLARQGEYPLHLDAVKTRLEDLLLEVGIRLLYGCNPIERTEDGLIIGSKGGLWKIPCLVVLDARIPLDTAPGLGAITLEFDGAAFPEYQGLSQINTELALPEKLGVPGNSVYLHRGYRSSGDAYLHGHVLVEVPVNLVPIHNLLDHTRRYIQARAQAVAVAAHLLWEHPAFRLAYLGKISDEVFVPTGNGEQSGVRFWSPDNASTPEASPFPDWDVIVVGGGTSGAIAAIAAAMEGARTLVVDMNPGLGGTGTYGGVRAYWMGWQKGSSALSTHWTDALHDRLRYPRMAGALPVWNVEAKTQALLEQAQAAGVDLLFEARVVGVQVQEQRVVGVTAATSLGLVALRAKIFIDATGDGDVADFAGAAYTYGSRRDGSVMWYSLAQFVQSGRYQGNFTSMVDIRQPEDYTRAALWGRRRRAYAGQVLHDHGGYIAPRESRHIHGEVIQTLADQLLGRAYPDVIALAASNNDMKGHTSADWMKIGLIPPNLYIEIAYGMLIPHGLDGLLVVGKAISAERDALPAIRMQPDLENLGGAAGMAAAFAVRAGVGVRDVNIHALQERLVQLGVLPAEVLDRKLVPFRPDQNAIQTWIEAILADDRPLWATSTMEVDEFLRGPIAFAALCCAGQQAIPWIEQALARPASSEARRKLGRALALMGAPAAVDVLVNELQRDLAGDRLPELHGEIRHAHRAAPDQAAMPETAYLLYALGMTHSERVLPIWQRVVDLLTGVNLEDVFSMSTGVFAYVDAVCSGAERLASPAAIPLLEKLQSYPALREHHFYRGIQADHLPERAAYLEIVIARALARCGSPRGALTLINYLGDVRKFYARHAHQELVAISGQDFGSDSHAWGQWLESTGEQITPQAWNPPLEAVAAWGENILVNKIV